MSGLAQPEEQWCSQHILPATPSKIMMVCGVTLLFLYLKDKLKIHMRKRHKLNSADTSGYYYSSWQRLNYATQPTPQSPLSVQKLITHALNLPTKKSAMPFGITHDSPQNIRLTY
eukprot:1149443-Pelagomonas_calceolata.AAC.1